MMTIQFYFATIQEPHLHSHLALPPTCIHLVTLRIHLLLSSFQSKLKVLVYYFRLKFGWFQKLGNFISGLAEQRKVACAEHIVLKLECLGWRSGPKFGFLREGFGQRTGLRSGPKFGFLREGFGQRTGLRSGSKFGFLREGFGQRTGLRSGSKFGFLREGFGQRTGLRSGSKKEFILDPRSGLKFNYFVKFE